jgi:glycoprotein endo-alpha-1,2-mannosidase
MKAFWIAAALTRILAGLCVSFDGAHARDASITRRVLAFYYGWWGDPQVSGHWVHWKNVDSERTWIDNSTNFPVHGAYDSHDAALVERQVREARVTGVTGFIISWWGQESFEDRGMSLLLDTARRHGLVVSAYYEKIVGQDAADRKAAAIADLDYLLKRYASQKGWLRADGKPVLFVYGRALRQLALDEWRDVIAQVRLDNPGGVVLVADSLDAKYLAVFDGASTYNITSQTQHKTPSQIREWAHAAYPKMVAAAGPGKISTVTVIPGYDDSKLGRPPPRPVTQRWGGETYRVLWQEAVAASPDYVLITSWNEWHEGSEIEPSVEYGSVMLNDTAVFAREFLGRR